MNFDALLMELAVMQEYIECLKYPMYAESIHENSYRFYAKDISSILREYIAKMEKEEPSKTLFLLRGLIHEIRLQIGAYTGHNATVRGFMYNGVYAQLLLLASVYGMDKE